MHIIPLMEGLLPCCLMVPNAKGKFKRCMDADVSIVLVQVPTRISLIELFLCFLTYNIVTKVCSIFI